MLYTELGLIRRHLEPLSLDPKVSIFLVYCFLYQPGLTIRDLNFMIDPKILAIPSLEYTEALFNIAAEPYLLNTVGANHINKHETIYTD